MATVDRCGASKELPVDKSKIPFENTKVLAVTCNEGGRALLYRYRHGAPSFDVKIGCRNRSCRRYPRPMT